MTTWKDIIIHISILAGFYIITLIFSDSIAHYFPWSFLIFVILLIIYYSIYRKSKNVKRVSDLIAESFSEMNYTILSERPLTIKEQFENLKLDFGPFINGVSINSFRYKNKMQRHFIVRNEKDHDFELIVTIIQTWGDKFKYNIESTSRIRN